MLVKKKLYVDLPNEEREILKKAQEILIEFENFSTSEQEEDLQALYDSFVGFIDHHYALPSAIDLIGAILEKGETDNEI